MTSDHERISRWQDSLLPHIVDRLACERPDAVYGMWPVAAATYDAGFRTTTYAQFGNVINGLARWLVEQLGPGRDNEVITYVGPNDVRLIALILAAIKAGYTLFLTSPRNSPAAHRSLFEALKCRTLVTTDPMPPPAVTILEAVNPRKLTAPGVDELLERTHEHFPLLRTFEDARWEPLLVIHTSGSTGLPKPLIWTHETVARLHNCTGHRPPDGIPSVDRFRTGKRVLVTVPPFHGAGILQYLGHAIPFGDILIAPAAAAIVTAQGLVDALKQTPAEVAILVPSVVAELAQNHDLLEYCASHLEMILYIGGDLPQSIGDTVAHKVRLRCLWGASEVGIPHQLLSTELAPTDWRYIRFHPCVGAVFEEANDGLYELVLQRDEALANTQAAFTIRGQEKLDGYRTRDLFEKHSTIPDTWRWKARADDIIVFLNGEKTNPTSMEQHVLSRNPELAGVIVIGAQRFQAALLIEPVSKAPLDTAGQAALIERIWLSVEEANKVTPAHARVEKSLILVTTPDRPLVRAAKGTLQKTASLREYSKDIDKLYKNADAGGDEDEPGTEVVVKADDPASVSALIQDSIRAIADLSIDDTTSFFDMGMDSLQALQLSRTLRRNLQRPDLALPTIYQNPTVPQLTAAILKQDDRIDDQDLMAPLLSTYRGLIHQIAKPKAFAAAEAGPVDVILTGSTGSLGTYFLRALLDREEVGSVFCLNRGKDGGRATQFARFQAANLSTHGLEDRVSFLQADLSQPSLGLESAVYETLRTRAGLVIHNAWPVNFNLGLSAFQPHFAGVVNLFALAAAAAPRQMRVLFISSVSSAANSVSVSGPAAETIYESFDAAFPNGYARSKLISELLCDTAARHVGIPVVIARVGQVAGPVRRPGLWNRAEWLPTIVISSLLHLHCLPDNLGPNEVDWVPSDLLADVIVDLAALSARSSIRHDAGPGAEVFNLRNPNIVQWHELLPTIQEAAQVQLKREIEVVSPSHWLARLQESVDAASKGEEKDLTDLAASNPAIKLLQYFQEGLWAPDAPSLAMSVDRAVVASPALRELPPVCPQWIRKWVDEWMAPLV